MPCFFPFSQLLLVARYKDFILATFGNESSGHMFGRLNSVANPLVYFFRGSPSQERHAGDFEDYETQSKTACCD